LLVWPCWLCGLLTGRAAAETKELVGVEEVEVGVEVEVEVELVGSVVAVGCVSDGGLPAGDAP